MIPKRIVATRMNGKWTARVSDGENPVAHGTGPTYSEAIAAAMKIASQSVLERQILGDLRPTG